MTMPGAARRRLPPDERWPTGDPSLRAHFHTMADGARVRVVTGGGPSGRPVVLLHGWACSAYSFRHLLPALAAAGYRVAAPDLRGHGQSDKPDDAAAYTADALGAHVAELVATFGGGDRLPVVIGHSLGGALTLRLALGPDAVAGADATVVAPRPAAIVLLNPAGLGPMPLATVARWLTPAPAAGVLSHVLWRPLFALVMGLVRSRADQYTARDLDEYWAPTAEPAFARALRHCVHSFDWRPLPADRLRHLAVPALVVTGTSDRLIGAMADDWAGWDALAAAGARLVPIRGGRHIVHEEQPRRVERLVLDFLRETAPAAG